MKTLFTWCFFSLMALSMSAQEKLKVATLHPLLEDLARKVGGDKVEVMPILKAGDDVHHFEPSATQMKNLGNCRIILACGKNLESFLPRIQANLREGQVLLPIGDQLPSIKVEGDVVACCPEHAKGAIDPHWWHSVDNFSRASKILAAQMSELDPANKDVYTANAKAFRKEMDALQDWMDDQISTIPRKDRKLVTAHSAFTYFCKENGFVALPLQGLSAETEVSPKYLAECTKWIQDNKVLAIFPEDSANPKVLQELAKTTGVKIGQALIADGTNKNAATIVQFFQHNVQSIVASLKP